MAHDAMRKRRTEIESIIGEIVRQGEAMGIPVPFYKGSLRAHESGGDSF